jgi:hypothetical protein
VIYSSHWVSNPAFDYKGSLFLTILFLSFFFASSSLFIFPLPLTPHDKQLALYTTTINNERKVPLSFSAYCPPLSLTLLTLTSSINTLLFLSRSNEMAADIGSKASGLDGHAVRLKIER